MPKYDLKQHFRGEDGKLYGPGKAVEVPKEAKLKLGGAVAKDEPPPPPTRPGLEGVDFASDEAGEAAASAQLTTADFQGLTPSGQGGFTKADVLKAAEAKKEPK